MISPHVRMLDLNPHQWRRLYDLFAVQPARRLVLVHENGRVLKAFDTEGGLRPDLKALRVGDPVAVAAHLHRSERVEQVLVLERTALDRFFSNVHALYDPDDDGDRYFQRVRLALDADPQLMCYPPEPSGLYLAGIPYDTWCQLLGRVPDGHTLVLGVFDGGSIWASLVVGILKGKVDLITTSDAVLPAEARIGQWRQGARLLLDRVASQIGPPFLGLFCERTAFLELVASEDKAARLTAMETEGRVLVAPRPACCRELQVALAGVEAGPRT